MNQYYLHKIFIDFKVYLCSSHSSISSHVLLSAASWYPGWHLHQYDPYVFWHMCPHISGTSAHSSISVHLLLSLLKPCLHIHLVYKGQVETVSCSYDFVLFKLSLTCKNLQYSDILNPYHIRIYYLKHIH